jgi:hypothetical protein
MVPFTIKQLPRSLRRDVENYLRTQPRSPAARLHPQLGVVDRVWVAFVGPVLNEGVVELGDSPRGALEDFSRHFMEPLISRNGSKRRKFHGTRR